jgi:aminobenzoyl-glutamate utilization protein B
MDYNQVLYNMINGSPAFCMGGSLSHNNHTPFYQTCDEKFTKRNCEMEKDFLPLKVVDEHSELITDVARSIWEHPELGLQEQHASLLLASELEKAGFSIQKGVAGMPTAFIAEWGQGKPIIGILGEYDALPGISQKISATKDPVKEGAPGHGCGHNLLGAAGFGTALAVREVMENDGIPGTLRYYGCPAEETLIGKIFMARAGVFDDLDAAVTWHPSDTNSVWGGKAGSTTALAMNSFKVRFRGRAAHAAGNPQQGRSALKAVQLLDIGVNYMREQIPQDARIHCVITNGGGAPNVVPPFAEVWYFVRAPKREVVDQIYAWVQDIIKGAALMTQTSYEIDFLTGCYEMLGNYTIHANMLEKMQQLGDLKFSEDDFAFARQLCESIPTDMLKATREGMEKTFAPGITWDYVGEYLNETVVTPNWELKEAMGGSTDVADVSYITPTANLTVSSAPLGTPGHSWQLVAASGHAIGFKGAIYAAKVMALTTLDLLTKPELLQAARDEFNQSTGGKKYVSPLPEGTQPH